MILYVNGDSHTAAAEAVNPHAFAEDDPKLAYLRRLPHPDNLAVSWGRLLSENLKAVFHCDAESAASNDRIMRTTRSWIDTHVADWPRTLMVIQWSTWEREEWLIDNTYYQINASGIDHVPDTHREKYKQFVANIDWKAKTHQAHEKIWELHQYLNDIGLKHVFFNGNTSFESIVDRKDWGDSYISPYDQKSTYHEYLQNNGFHTVSQTSWHYGADAHRRWAKYILQYLIDHKLL